MASRLAFFEDLGVDGTTESFINYWCKMEYEETDPSFRFLLTLILLHYFVVESSGFEMCLGSSVFYNWYHS